MESLSTFDNYFKTQYLEKGLADVRPKYTPLMASVEFVKQSEKAGSVLEFPVLTSYEHGFTAHGQAGDQTQLEAATVAQNRKARIFSYPFSGRTQIDTVTAFRSANDAQSFVKAISYKVENLQRSFSLMLEIMMIRGGIGLGVVSAGAEADGTYGGVSFTDGISGTKLKLANKDFADHIWIGSEGMPVDLYSSAGSKLLTTKIVSYDTENEWIEVESLGSIVDAQDVVVYRKGFKDNEGVGLLKIMRQTASSGSLFNIDSGSTPLWRVSQYNCGNAPLSFNKVADGVARAKGRGLGEKLTLHVHPQTFSNLMPDFNTVKDTGSDFKSRVFTDAGQVKQLEHGTYGIKFFVDGVELTVVSNSLIPKGEAIGCIESELRRAGSTDITYETPGMMGGEGKYFHRLPEAQALELRIFADMTLAPLSLNQFIRFHSINNGLPQA